MNSIENDIVKRTMSIAMLKAITTIMFVCSTILISSFTYTIICISYLSITGWLLRLEQRLLSTIQDYISDIGLGGIFIIRALTTLTFTNRFISGLLIVNLIICICKCII